jgi:sulfur-carrier protein
MAVTVSIPTILRTHTGGEKTVEAKGSTVAEVIDDLEARHPGIAGRLVNNGKLHRFVNIYVDDEDIRFSGGLEAPVGENSTFTILPAVAGGAPDPSATTVAHGSTRTRVAGG